MSFVAGLKAHRSLQTALPPGENNSRKVSCAIGSVISEPVRDPKNDSNISNMADEAYADKLIDFNPDGFVRTHTRSQSAKCSRC